MGQKRLLFAFEEDSNSSTVGSLSLGTPMSRMPTPLRVLDLAS